MIINRAKGTHHPTKVYIKDYELGGGYKTKVWIGRWPNDGPFLKPDYEPVIYITDPRGKTHAVARAHWGLTTYANIKPHKDNPDNFSPYIPNSWHTPYFDAEHVELPDGAIQKATWFLAKLDHVTSGPTPLYKELVAKKGVENDLPQEAEGLEVKGFSETVVREGMSIWKKIQRDISCSVIKRGRRKIEMQKSAIQLAMRYSKRGIPIEKAIAKIQRKFGFSPAFAAKLAETGYYNGEAALKHLEEREKNIGGIEEKYEAESKILSNRINAVLKQEKQRIELENVRRRAKEKAEEKIKKVRKRAEEKGREKIELVRRRAKEKAEEKIKKVRKRAKVF